MIYIGAAQYRFDKDGPKGLLLASLPGVSLLAILWQMRWGRGLLGRRWYSLAGLQ